MFDFERKALVWAWGQNEISGPHDATVLANGNFLLFDNGVRRGWSRAIELDPVTKRIVWEYNGDKKFFSLGNGTAQRLPNGNTFLAISYMAELREVTPAGELVWRFVSTETLPTEEIATLPRARRYGRRFIDALLADEPAVTALSD